VLAALSANCEHHALEKREEESEGRRRDARKEGVKKSETEQRDGTE